MRRVVLALSVVVPLSLSTGGRLEQPANRSEVSAMAAVSDLIFIDARYQWPGDR